MCQLGQLTSRFNRRIEYEKLLVGTVAAAIGNFSMRAPEEALCPADFIAGLRRRADPEQSEEDIAAHFDAVFGPRAVPVYGSKVA